VTSRWRLILPGLGLALLLAALGQWLSQGIGTQVLGLARSPVSPILLAIVLGMLLRNLFGLPGWSEAGVRFALSRVLRLGIVLLGIRLSLSEIGSIGLRALPVIVICVTVALLLVSRISQRIGLSARLGTLIAAGTGICGATAIVALAPVIRARDEETAFAVACITIFGMLAMLTYPFAAHWLFAGDGFRVGLFLGTAVHDTAQVAGAGLVYQQYFGDTTALDTATVTKLVRNLGMLLVIPLLGFAYQRKHHDAGSAVPWYAMVPLFVLGFALLSLVRTIGDLGEQAFGLIPQVQWQAAVGLLNDGAEVCLGVAMAAVGLGTSFRGLREIGYRPFAVGLLSALLVSLASLALILCLY
jgi:uncharacterized integral membrane protein (TIGR00698 family)